MRPTFEKTVDILVKAYLNDTLEHANCSACAVGNIIAHSLGTKPLVGDEIKAGERWRFKNGEAVAWMNVFCSNFPKIQNKFPGEYIGDAKKQIDSTGYTWRELALIEYAFEKDSDRWDMRKQPGVYKDKLMFQGLMNVVDVLADIHNVDLSVREEAKLLFVKP